ncbi:hypothetical protein [Nocardia sp. NPDC004711]
MTQEQARKVCEITLLVLPVFAISFLITDRDKMASDTEAGLDDDTLKFRAVFEFGLSVIYIILTIVGMSAAVVGLVFRIHKPLLLTAVDCLGLCLAILMMGALEVAAARLARILGKTAEASAPRLEGLAVLVVSLFVVLIFTFDCDFALEASLEL